jgi:hypothetical protein
MSQERNWWHWMPDEYAPTPTQPVTVFPSEPINTGVLDANGNPIMRNPEQIGFLRGEK